MHPDYFLSDTNPAATVDQRDLEGKALELLQRPELKRARDIVTMLWRSVMAWPARDQMDRFDNMIEEYLFHYALHAANPRVLRFMEPAGHWFGRDVPGSRWAGDSPDFIYRIIPIDPAIHYRLRGRATCDVPPTVTYSLVSSPGAAPATRAILDSLDLEFGPDGEFEITINDTDADGKPNHLQTQPGVDHLMIRDALGDWLAQTPNQLQVERLDDPGIKPKSDEQLAATAAQRALNSFYYTFFCTQSGSGQPPNELRPPLSSAPFGGMATQWGTKGNLCLEEDDALIVTTNSAGAGFRNAVLCDAFHMSIRYWEHTSSLNMDQMAPDADGNFTFVVAHRDPGVHNWLDTGGLRRTIFGHRWQAFPGGECREEPRLSCRKVKFDELESALPEGVAGIDASGRKAQLEARLAGFRKRFVDS